MKKRLFLIGVLLLAVAAECFLIVEANKTLRFSISGEELVLSVKCNQEEENIKPYYNNDTGTMYFFLPSFVKNNSVYGSEETENLIIDGESVGKMGKLDWQEESEYRMDWNGEEYEVKFMNSENLPTLFISTESGSLDYLNADKENRESGYLKLIENNANLEFEGDISISERGNSTFYGARKKSFSFTTEKKQPLCGMEAGKKWNLLSLYYEQNKLSTKLVFDMADYLGMEYTPDCTWVDLYVNGSYEGLYLLTEAVTVGEGRVELHDLEDDNEAANPDVDLDTVERTEEENCAYFDIESPENISGGYLIEKDRMDRIDQIDEAYFITDADMLFKIKFPKTASREEVDYIDSFIQRLETLIMNKDSEYKNYVDEESLANQFLIDKIVLEADAMTMSTFYCLDQDTNVLKAGPLWDYDRAFGLVLTDYTRTIEEYPGDLNCWYVPLYQDEEFKTVMLERYRELLSCLESMLANGIDEYVEWISASRQMDQLRWGDTGEEVRIYREYENYIRYLKYFLIRRLEFLNELWGIDYNLSDYENLYSDEMHKVVVLDVDGNTVVTYRVKDGECISKLPEVDEDSQWYVQGTNSEFSSQVPVFEDMTFEMQKN